MSVEVRTLVIALWTLIGLALFARPDWLARLRREDPSIVAGHPVSGWPSYGTTVRLGGAVLVLMAVFVAAITTFGGR